MGQGRKSNSACGFLAAAWPIGNPPLSWTSCHPTARVGRLEVPPALDKWEAPPPGADLGDMPGTHA